MYGETERIQGIVERVTFHNEDNGWSVLKVKCYNDFNLSTVIVHQTKVFAGATMKFTGSWGNHPKFGRQFTAQRAEEQKPASAAALEKYLGSGLIKGVGPKTARRIVSHFGSKTLDVFESSMEDLLQVPGIAKKKLQGIRLAWEEHRAIRDVMLFLQQHGISTLFAVRIFKKYGDKAISIVSKNPYQLANDFYGIGFFSADKVALSFGIEKDAPMRVFAAIRHILASSRDKGHCYLTIDQIIDAIKELLDLNLTGLVDNYLHLMEQDNLLKKRRLCDTNHIPISCYYSKSLYYDEENSARDIRVLSRTVAMNFPRLDAWMTNYGKQHNLTLSEEQSLAVKGMVKCGLSILSGGPGCGKTTTTQTLVQLFIAMGKKVLLAAPTGRAAQRMGEVVGLEAKTIHRLLEFQNGGFKKGRQSPLHCDVLVVDECSMLDISLSAALLSAMPAQGQLVLVGDPDQLPSVGPGNVLGDMIESGVIPIFQLKKIFRQARDSRIISHAHTINSGNSPPIPSPFNSPQLWREKCDCLFIDSNEATQKQLALIKKAKHELNYTSLEEEYGEARLYGDIDGAKETIQHDVGKTAKQQWQQDSAHIDFGLLQTAENSAQELRAVLKKVHPWSSLHYGLTASQVLLRLYAEWIPKYFGSETEIQVLSPMTRGSLGTVKINEALQDAVNPRREGKAELTLGERIFRVGDRVIHRKNNYELGVFNGDIGKITAIQPLDFSCKVCFSSDNRIVSYERDQLSELDLAYGITIHKSQGSEFDCVIIPLVSQHFTMLFRNLIYTGLTRAKKLAVFVGTRQALGMAVRNVDTATRQTALNILLKDGRSN